MGNLAPQAVQAVAPSGRSALHLEQGLYFLPHSEQNLVVAVNLALQAEQV